MHIHGLGIRYHSNRGKKYSRYSNFVWRRHFLITGHRGTATTEYTQFLFQSIALNFVCRKSNINIYARGFEGCWLGGKRGKNVPSKKSEEWISSCVEGCLALSYTHFCIILIFYEYVYCTQCFFNVVGKRLKKLISFLIVVSPELWCTV